jgi:hypothetical protein
MKEYTEKEYKTTFGEKAWEEKVQKLAGSKDIESVYATDLGNVFCVIKKSVK